MLGGLRISRLRVQLRQCESDAGVPTAYHAVPENETYKCLSILEARLLSVSLTRPYQCSAAEASPLFLASRASPAAASPLSVPPAVAALRIRCQRASALFSSPAISKASATEYLFKIDGWFKDFSQMQKYFEVGQKNEMNKHLKSSRNLSHAEQ